MRLCRLWPWPMPLAHKNQVCGQAAVGQVIKNQVRRQRGQVARLGLRWPDWAADAGAGLAGLLVVGGDDAREGRAVAEAAARGGLHALGFVEAVAHQGAQAGGVFKALGCGRCGQRAGLLQALLCCDAQALGILEALQRGRTGNALGLLQGLAHDGGQLPGLLPPRLMHCAQVGGVLHTACTAA